MEERVCVVCGKDISNLRSIAKYCSVSCQQKFRRKTYPEKIRISQQRYYIKNKTKCLQGSKARAQANPEMVRKKNLKYYISHRNKCIERSILWHKDNPTNPEVSRQRARTYRHKYRFKINERMKIHHRVARLTLKDSYVKRLLVVSMFPVAEITQEMITSKRELLLLTLKLNKINNESSK